jgi:hypothetical protein
MASLGIVDANIGEAVASASLTLNLGSLSASKLHIYSDSTLDSLQVFVNSTAYSKGAVVDVVQGDVVRFTGNAASSYNTPKFVNLLVEGVLFVSCVVLTKQDPINMTQDPAYIGKPKPDYLAGYVPQVSYNKLTKVNVLDDTSFSVPIIPCASTVAGTRGDGRDYLFVADYVNNFVHRIDPETLVNVESISINKPFCISNTPSQTYFPSTITHTLISSPNDNRVYVFDGDQHTLLTYITTGTGPYGVCGDLDRVEGSYSFWVACFTANRVEHWQFTLGGNLLRDFYYDLPAGSGPYDIAIDAGGNALVTCLISNKLARCPAGGGGTIQYVNVGVDPWSVELSGDYAYVACFGATTISAVNLNTFTVTNMPAHPNVSAVCVALGKLYAGSFDSGDFRCYNLSGATITLRKSINNNRMFEGLVASSSANHLFAVSLYSDAPNRLSLPDNTPNNIVLTAQSDVRTNTAVNSNTLTVTGIASSTTFTVPALTGGIISPFIEKNDVNSGTSVAAQNNDRIEVRFTSPASGRLVPLIEIPLVYNGGYSTWTLSMRAALPQRVGGWVQGG